MNVSRGYTIKAVFALFLAWSLGTATVLAQRPDADPATAKLPGPRGVMIPVPPAVQRNLTDFQKKLHGQLRGNERTYYVIGLLESTWQPRSATIGDGIRGVVAVLDVVLLPTSLIVGEPMFLSNQLPPAPPDWRRHDEPQVHLAKGQDAAIKLVYAYMTARLLDPPDPQTMRRIRTWYLLQRTGSEVVAEKSVKQIKQAMARAAGPSGLGDALSRFNELFAKPVDKAAAAPAIDPNDPQVKPLLKEYRDLMTRAKKMENAEFVGELRKLNELFAAVLPAE